MRASCSGKPRREILGQGQGQGGWGVGVGLVWWTGWETGVEAANRGAFGEHAVVCVGCLEL